MGGAGAVVAAASEIWPTVGVADEG